MRVVLAWSEVAKLSTIGGGELVWRGRRTASWIIAQFPLSTWLETSAQWASLLRSTPSS